MTDRLLAGNDVDTLVSTLAALDKEHAEIKEAAARIRAELRDRLGVGKHNAAGLTVTVRENRRFNAERAAAVLDAATADLCSLWTIDRKRAQDVLTPEQYRDCQTVVGDPVVTIK